MFNFDIHIFQPSKLNQPISIHSTQSTNLFNLIIFDAAIPDQYQPPGVIHYHLIVG